MRFIRSSQSTGRHSLHLLSCRVRNRYCVNQTACIGMFRIVKDCGTRPNLDYFPHVHHRHSVAHTLNYRHIMANEYEAQAQLLLQFEQQIHNLDFYRYI